MAERAISHKKANFLDNLAPVTVSFDELVRDKLECGKFPLTKTGWIKIIAMIVSAAGLALFLAQQWDVCKDKPDWFDVVFPACVGSNIVVQLLFYMIFSCGGTIKYPGKWVATDIILNLIFSIVGIVGSIMTTATRISCTENVSMHEIPGPLGITGGVLSVVGCAAIFLMYRYVDEDDEIEAPQQPQRNIDPRKSMHA